MLGGDATRNQVNKMVELSWHFKEGATAPF
jgi:hypothetical protein